RSDPEPRSSAASGSGARRSSAPAPWSRRTWPQERRSPGIRLGHYGERARRNPERHLDTLTDVVAVDLDRERPGAAILARRDRADDRLGHAFEVLDLAMAGTGAPLAEQSRDQGRHVTLGRTLEDSEREGPIVDLHPLTDAQRPAREVGERVGVLGKRRDA